MYKLGIVGLGKMGGAILTGILNSIQKNLFLQKASGNRIQRFPPKPQ